jgi:hypothetical protein
MNKFGISRGLLVTVLLLAACRPQAPGPTSPNQDTQPPSTSPGSGDVIGADQVSPAQKLEEGPKLDSEKGVVPSAEPPKN